jgi:hypothetical protein
MVYYKCIRYVIGSLARINPLHVDYMHELRIAHERITLLEIENMKLTVERDTLRYIESILMSTCANNPI